MDRSTTISPGGDISGTTQFTTKDTQIHKGICVLLLLALHAFVRSDFSLYAYTWMLNGKPWLNPVMANEKICVTIFVILSGYGLSESMRRQFQSGIQFQLRFLKSHLLKLYTNFWFVFIIFAGIGLVGGYITFADEWGAGKQGLLSFFIDFLGLQDIVKDFWKTPTLNPTWWFMGTIIVLYLLFPILYFVTRKIWWLPFSVGIALNFYAPYPEYSQVRYGWIFYLAAFCFGILASEKQLFSKVRRLQ